MGSTVTNVHLEAALFCQPFSRKLVVMDLSAFSPSSYAQLVKDKAAALLLVLDTVLDLTEFW